MSRGEEPQPDVILDRDELEFKHYSDGTTLLLLTYLFDRPDEPETQRRFETPISAQIQTATNGSTYTSTLSFPTCSK
jgi:hypothetical protein